MDHFPLPERGPRIPTADAAEPINADTDRVVWLRCDHENDASAPTRTGFDIETDGSPLGQPLITAWAHSIDDLRLALSYEIVMTRSQAVSGFLRPHTTNRRFPYGRP